MAAVKLQKLLPEKIGSLSTHEVKVRVLPILMPTIDEEKPVKPTMPPEEHGYLKANKYDFY